jgi:hypothetical protein
LDERGSERKKEAKEEVMMKGDRNHILISFNNAVSSAYVIWRRMEDDCE